MVASPPRPGPERHRHRWEETDASGPTGADTGRAGHRTGWTPDGWTLDGWTLDGWTPDSGRWTGGHQTAGPPDPGRRHQVTGHRTDWTPDGRTAGPRTTNPDGWTPHAGCGPPTDAKAGVLAVRPRRRCPTAGCRLDAPPGRPRWGEQPARTAQQHGLQGTRRCYGRAWPPPRRSAAGATPPSSWRLGALLSSEDFGSRVGREAHGQVLWRAHLRRVLWLV
jgi:hypothetical protein